MTRDKHYCISNMDKRNFQKICVVASFNLRIAPEMNSVSVLLFFFCFYCDLDSIDCSITWLGMVR